VSVRRQWSCRERMTPRRAGRYVSCIGAGGSRHNIHTDHVLSFVHSQVTAFARRGLRVGALVTALAGSSAALGAQSLAVGRFEGEVRSRAGQPLGAAEVRVEDRQGRAMQWTLTARDGRFHFDALPSGRYDVTIEALGYRPEVHLDVRIGAGFTAQLSSALTPAAAPVTQVDTVPHRGDATTLGQWLVDRGYGDLTSARRISADLSAFSPNADAFGVEGLPWRMTSLVVDGARAGNAAAPAGSGAEAAGLALPVRAVTSAAVGGLGYDVELGGSGVGINATTRRGGRAMGSRGSIEGGTAALGGSYQLFGPLQGDTAQGIIGLDYQRNERDFWNDAWTVDPRVEERATAFGRIDWQGSDRLAISARLAGGRVTSRGYGEMAGLPAQYGSDYEAIAGQGSVNVFARFAQRVATEWRVAADASRSEGRAGALPRGFDATDLGRYAGAMGTPHRELRATPRVTGMLHVDAGAHRVKVGVTGSSQRSESEYVRDSDGQFVFGATPGPLANAAWRGVESAEIGTTLRMRESAFFVQDDWQVVPGLSVALGLRMESFRVPVSRIERNAAWAAVSGLDNTDVAPRESAVSPRIGFRWELGGASAWVIEGGAGTFRDLPDVRDVAEALILDRSADVRYGIGTLPSASAPSAADVPVVGQTLTLLAPDFGGTRTQRLSLGITRRLGTWSASVSGVYRVTDGIARRRDLNLPAFAAGEDQDGRQLYGSLEQIGAALVATPQSNRRFANFDAVHVLEGSGTSEYWGVTAGVERVLERGLSLTAFYTYSQTTDNLPQFGRAISAFPDGLNGRDWADGVSDLDVPHRAMLALDWRPSDAFSVGAMYRIRSGLPFTPGFRGGVDANGDGDWTNDAAFVDAALPGMSDVLDEYSCLKSGTFAVRNSCRGEFAHSVDLRASFRIARLAMGRLDLVLDAVDVLALNSAPIDGALLLVNSAGAVTVNPGTGVTTVPYVVNPAFGAPAVGRTPGVLWRVGLRVTP
jgi:hypothetical protein